MTDYCAILAACLGVAAQPCEGLPANVQLTCGPVTIATDEYGRIPRPQWQCDNEYVERMCAGEDSCNLAWSSDQSRCFE